MVVSAHLCRFAAIFAVSAALCPQAGVAQALNPLTREEATLVSQLHFDASLMEQAKRSGTGFVRLMALTDNGDEVPAPGIVLITAPGQADSVLQALRRRFAGTDYGAWINDDGFGREPDKIAIMKSRNQYTYLEFAHTDGINFGLTHEDVVRRYREWAAKYGLVLSGAGLDWLSARINKPPADWEAFAAQVAKFCPDIVEQGTGDVASLAREMRDRRLLYLWWD